MLVTLVLTAAGSCFLALAMDRHHRAMFGHAPTPTGKQNARIIGGLLVLAGLVWACAVKTIGIGFVEWMIALGLASTLAGFALPLLKDGRKSERPTVNRRR